jgi:hypothetical protein
MEYQQTAFGADTTPGFVAHCTAVIGSKMELRKDANAARRADGAER